MTHDAGSSMRQFLTIMRKECVDNVRDKRAMASALLFGPVFGPVLIALMLSLVLERSVSDADESVSIPVIGAERAPNLVEFASQYGVDTESTQLSRDAAVRSVTDGEIDAVLIVPDAFGNEFTAGVPARLELVWDQSNRNAEKTVRRVRAVLQMYSRKIGALRLQARGVDPRVAVALLVDDVDVSTPAGRSVLVLGVLTYFLLFSLLMGGLHVAIDTTAGERERGSLEPLLTLPVTRTVLMLGKIAATCVFMAISAILTLIGFSIALGFVPLEKIGMVTNFGPDIVLVAFFILLPFVLPGAAMMTVVASFTRSFKEAQTWVGAVLLVPTLPIMVAGALQLKSQTLLMLVPGLSQHLLVTGLIRNDPVAALDIVVSITSTLVAGALLTMLAARLYRRESLLG
jgi:sodium transport system permease protein